MTEAISRVGFSEALHAQIANNEQRLATARSKLLEGSRQRQLIIPHPRIIEGNLRNLLAFWTATSKGPGRSWPGTCRP